MQSHRVIAVTLLALAFGSAPSLAQSAEPMTQQLCVTFTHAPGTVISPSTLEAGLADGTVTVTVVESSEACLPAEGDSVFPPIVLSSDGDEWLAFLARSGEWLDEAQDRDTTFSKRLDHWANTGDPTSFLRASRAISSADQDELDWLDENPPRDCYVDVFDAYHSVMTHEIKAQKYYQRGVSQVSGSILKKGISEQKKSNDALDDLNTAMDSVDVADCSF